MVMPGDNVEMTVELITPIAMDKTQRFAIARAAARSARASSQRSSNNERISSERGRTQGA
jgi:translation elongation factor EF-Tu-like GTPase